MIKKINNWIINNLQCYIIKKVKKKLKKIKIYIKLQCHIKINNIKKINLN